MAEKCLDFSITKLVLSDVISHTNVNANRTKINFVSSRNQLYPAWIYEAKYQAAYGI